jgi:UDPglucose 6-dehydrogenase
MIGTGYVGLVTGICLAHIGHNVTCVDIDTHKIEMLKKGELPIFEPGLEDLLKVNVSDKRLHFTNDIKQAVQNSQVIFIAVGTPPAKDGNANLTNVFEAAHDIAAALNEYKVIVNKSTVPVGTAEKVSEIIQKNKKSETDFSVVSNPEFLKEGSAIKDIFEGDRIVIGVEDQNAQAIMEQLYKPLSIPVYVTDVKSAEMIKYASNAFLATKISFINEIANVCEKVGADITKVAGGMGLDKRIGASFLNAGLGYGGSCFPKDAKALVETAKQAGYHFKILNAVIEVNDKQKQIMVDKISKYVSKLNNPVVGILGLAFKPNTDDIREAPSLYIIQKLKEQGIKLKAYDPIAMENTKIIIPDITYCSNLYDACRDVDVVVITTEWEEFKNMDLDIVKDSVKTPLIIDGRNIFDPIQMNQKGFKYISIGR